MKIKEHQKDGVIMCIIATVLWTAFGFLVHPFVGIMCFGLCAIGSGALIHIYCIEDEDENNNNSKKSNHERRKI
jgi:hypothetical protein